MRLDFGLIGIVVLLCVFWFALFGFDLLVTSGGIAVLEDLRGLQVLVRCVLPDVLH